MSTFLRQNRLNWYGHIGRIEDNLSRKMMDMVAPGKRRRGRPKRRWFDNTREDREHFEMTTVMTEQRKYWKIMMKAGPQSNGDCL